MDEYLSIQDISCGYKSGFQLNNIRFSVKKGSFTGIIGPNGSGKTTLFKGISGELALKKGNILLNGQMLNKMNMRQKARHIAIVSQFTNIESIRVEDYILMGRMPYHKQFQLFETKEDKEIAAKYMEMTGIAHLRDKNREELSGGEQQMVNIACALTQEPDILLLDEPTTHLDITHQVQFMNLVQRLNEQLKLTVIMIIHDLNLASEYCDYLLMMKDGHIYKQGKPEDIITFENIEEVYKTVVVAKINPVSQKPVIFPVSEKRLKNININNLSS